MPSRKKESGDGANGAKPFIISRVFDAPRDVVWKAHTECAHLKHWWGPKGFAMTHCEIDLRPGGFFHYGLMSPDGQAIWGKFLFREVALRRSGWSTSSPSPTPSAARPATR